MKNRLKVLCLALAVAMLTGGIAGCSGGNNTEESSTEASAASESSTAEASTESSAAEVSVESSEATVVSVEENSSESSSDSSAIDPSVEERSYTEEEKHKYQDTKFVGYQYVPSSKTYAYTGTLSELTILSEFTTCPDVDSKSVKTIIVPETVTSIPAGAFYGCTNLEKLVILNPDCEIEETVLPKAKDSKYAAHNNKLVDIYCYFMADKSVPENSQWGKSTNSAVLNVVGKWYSSSDYYKYVHDLASESYE